MSTILLAVYVLVILGLIQSLMKKTKENMEKRDKNAGNRSRARSTDGHVLKGDRDITCRRFGHRHSRREEPEMRFIVHDDPKQGYIILNGIEMRITDADRYENSI